MKRHINENILTRGADTAYAFRFLRLLTTPWKELEAYKLGIIDANGKVLKKQSSLKSTEEKSAYNLFHRLVFNVKRIINAFPGGKSTIGSYLSALWLLKEGYQITEKEIIEALAKAGVSANACIVENNFPELSGEYTLNRTIAFPLTGETLALAGSSLVVEKQVGTIMSIPVYSACHETGQTIYITPNDIK